MPRVPQYSRQVAPGSLPAARSRISYTPQDVSGGLDRAAAAIADPAVAEAKRAKADQEDAQLMLAYSEAGKARGEIESTVRQQYQGKAALDSDLEAQTSEMFARMTKDIGERYTDEHMRTAVGRILTRENDQLREKMRGYVTEQMDVVSEGAYKGALATATSKATADLGQGKQTIEARDELVSAIEARAVTKGWDPKLLEAERRHQLTIFHGGVAEALQAADRAPEAEAYLTLHEKEMDGGKVADLRKTLLPATTAAKAEAEVRKIEAAIPDEEGRAAAVLALEGPVGAKARDVYRERQGLLQKARDDAQKKELGTVFDSIEKGALPTKSALERHPSFGKLDDEHAARARAYWRQLQQAERTVLAAERQAIQLSDDSARKDFEAMPLQQRAEADVRSIYAGRTSIDGLNVIRKLQNSAKRDWDKDRGVGETEFRRIVLQQTEGLPGLVDGKEEQAQLLAYVGRERARFMEDPKNGGREPNLTEVQKMIADSMVVIDLPLRRDKPRYKAGGDPGRGPAAEQPYQQKRRPAEAPAATPADQGIPPMLARPPEPAAAPVGTRVLGETIGFPKGTEFEVTGPNKYKRVK